LRKIPEKFSGISRNLFSYLIPLKIRKLGDKGLNNFLGISKEAFRRICQEFLGVKIQRNSQEFLETIF